MGMRPTHNLCIGRKILGRKKPDYTAVGVGWWDAASEQMMVSLNIRLLLEPGDNIYLFPRKSSDMTAQNPDDVSDEPF